MSDQENQASRFARDMAANAEKIFKATQLIANTRDEDISIGTTPKHLVMRRD
jgi:polyhydroxyalkanoate synthase